MSNAPLLPNSIALEVLDKAIEDGRHFILIVQVPNGSTATFCTTDEAGTVDLLKQYLQSLEDSMHDRTSH